MPSPAWRAGASVAGRSGRRPTGPARKPGDRGRATAPAARCPRPRATRAAAPPDCPQWTQRSPSWCPASARPRRAEPDSRRGRGTTGSPAAPEPAAWTTPLSPFPTTPVTAAAWTAGRAGVATARPARPAGWPAHSPVLPGQDALAGRTASPCGQANGRPPEACHRQAAGSGVRCGRSLRWPRQGGRRRGCRRAGRDRA